MSYLYIGEELNNDEKEFVAKQIKDWGWCYIQGRPAPKWYWRKYKRIYIRKEYESHQKMIYVVFDPGRLMQVERDTHGGIRFIINDWEQLRKVLLLL